MNFKTTYILFGALVAVLGVFAATQLLGVKKPGQLSNYVLPSLHKTPKEPVQPNSFDAIEIRRLRPKEETFLFVRRNGGWDMEKPYRLHADGNRVQDLIRQVATATHEKAELGSSLQEYELNAPTAVITLRRGVDETWKLNVGRESPLGDANKFVYVNSSDRPSEPLAVKRSALKDIFNTLDDFRAKDLLEASALNVKFLSLQPAGKEGVVLEEDPDEPKDFQNAHWRFVKPAFGEADFVAEGPPAERNKPDNLKPISGVRDLLEAVGGIQIQDTKDFVTAEASDADLAKYGLEHNKPSYLRIDIKRTTTGMLGAGGQKADTIEQTLLIGNKVEDSASRPGPLPPAAGDKTEKRYVRLASEKAVAKVAAKSLEGLIKIAEDPAPLRDRNLIRTTNLKGQVDAVDIQNAAGAMRVRGQIGKRKIYTSAWKGRGVDDHAIGDLLDALGPKRQVKGFPEIKEADMGFDKPDAITVSLWVHGLAKPEPAKDDKKDGDKEKKDNDTEPKLKDEKPTVKLTFGKEDKDTVYVRREIGEKKRLFTVAKSLKDLAARGPLAYLEKNIPSFSNQATVTEVVLQRGGDVYEIANDDQSSRASQKWKLKKPQGLAGRSADPAAVNGIVRALMELKPTKLEAESAKDLEPYGLKTPSVQATVKVKGEGDEAEDRGYLFGKETADKTGVYTKQAKHDLIFVVSADVLKTLNAELQDPTVLRFDVNKVKAIKLTGWKKEVGSTFTLDLERKGVGQWTVKAPADFDIEPSQADAFIDSLANLRALRFLVRQKGPRPEDQLGPKDANLRIEISVDGEKQPLVLTVGALDAKEKAYHAQSSAAPGDVFLLPQTQFEPALAGPKYFSKKPAPAMK